MIAFIVMVMLFRVTEKVITPTTVILMTIVPITGFLTHLFVIRDFTGVVPHYWLAAVPVVCVGGPIGALACSKMSRLTIGIILVCLIAVDFSSTIWLVPMSTLTKAIAAIVLVVCVTGIYLMTRVRRYEPAQSPPLVRVPEGA
jgi:hypothetical protein